VKYGREINTVHGIVKFSWSDTCWEPESMGYDMKDWYFWFY